jgi:hypothetical protein
VDGRGDARTRGGARMDRQQTTLVYRQRTARCEGLVASLRQWKTAAVVVLVTAQQNMALA